MTYHNPVLPTIAIDWLDVQPGEKYIDATLGGGSHTAEIIRRGGIVLGLDQDLEAINACPDLDHLTKVHANFTQLKEVALKHGFLPVSGILFDLGVSQHQVVTAGRGFSFQREGPLDMRMGTSAVTASELVNRLSVNQLASIFKDFGEEPQANLIARRIVNSRPIETTSQLAQLIGNPERSRRTFQALRIAVNDELGSIATSLPVALEVLQVGGRLVVISFHSLEDRLVKQQFMAWQKAGRGQILTKKPVLGERGSKLRAFVKI